MNKLLSTLLLLLLLTIQSLGQVVNMNEYGCGTVTSDEEIQEVYRAVKFAPLLKKTAGGVDTIPLTLHIVGRNDGSGYYRLETLLRVICDLNTQYKPAGLYFFIQWPIRYINNTNYYSHDLNNGIEMMSTYNVPRNVNVYFVSNANGNCGYYATGPNAIAIRNSCSGVNSTTLAHELGHFFGLPHTFYGWENGQTPLAPEKVTRGPGANCGSAGDGFCDTDADYLAARWSCPYRDNKTDANGDKYHPDSSLYMSYADDVCMTRFSQQQMDRMKISLNSKSTYLLDARKPAYTEFENSSILYPTDSMHANLPYVVWNSLPGAEAYYVRVTQDNIPLYKQEITTADTVLQMNFAMIDNAAYTIRISAMNGVNVCRKNTATFKYIYTNNNTERTLQSFSGLTTGIRMFPNPANEAAKLFLDFVPKGNYNIVMADAAGRIIRKFDIIHPGNATVTFIEVKDLVNGLYFIKVSGNGFNFFQKLIVAH